MKWIGLLLAVAAVRARKFNNPVQDNGDYPDPGGIKVGDRYYVVTTTNNKNAEKFPITTSTDLQNWSLVGYMFNASNIPPWSDKDHEYWAPEIHKIGNQYVSYWAARYTKPNPNVVNDLYVGVATAPEPYGPWTSLDEPLFSNAVHGAIDATLMRDNDTLYLLWKNQANGAALAARRLSPDGLSFANASETETILFGPTLDWEYDDTEGPWHIKRGKYHYVMYSGQWTCGNYGVGVARSLNPLGPYEKRGDPILYPAPGTRFLGPGHHSVVKDVDGVNDVMLFHIHRPDVSCDIWRPMNAASMGWGDDDWPYVYDYE